MFDEMPDAPKVLVFILDFLSNTDVDFGMLKKL